MSGWRVSTLGRRPDSRRSLSHTASLILSVTKLRLVSGLLIAEISTPDGATWIKPRSPRQGVGSWVDIVFVAVRGAGHLPQNAAGDVAFKIGPVGEPEITGKLDATADDMNLFRLELP